MGDPMDMAAAFQAFQRQAPEQLDAARRQLEAVGLGFTAEDREVIAAQAAAHPFPSGHDPDAEPSADDVAAAQAVAAQAMAAEYPREGFQPDDPRIAPVEGVSIATYALAAKAIGWSTEPAFIERVARAIGPSSDSVCVYDRQVVAGAHGFEQRATEGDFMVQSRSESTAQRGSPSTRSPMMLRRMFEVPPMIV